MTLPFLQGQSKRRDQIVAIDLGARQTKAVHLQFKNNRYTLLGYTVQDAVAGDKEVSSESLSEHIKSITAALGSKSRHVALALGVSETVLRQAELPLMAVPELRQMLKFNSKTYLQQDLPDHVFDCSIVLQSLSRNGTEPGKAGAEGKGSLPTKQKVIIGGTRQTMLNKVADATRAAGLHPENIAPGVVGPANAFEISEPEAFAQEVVALVDIGFKNTSIIILKKGELVLNRVVTLGADRLTSGLSEALGISYPEAEGIKVGMPAEVQHELRPLLSPIGRELRASIDFFEHQQDTTVSRVFVSGGTARNEWIVQALQAELMTPCSSWNPAKTFQLSLTPQQQEEIAGVAPQLVVALGTAIAAL